MCYMADSQHIHRLVAGPIATITHREMRNNSGDVLRRAAAGELIQVTNNGRVVAMIGPPSESMVDELLRRGLAQPATEPLATLGPPIKAASRSGAEILADVRGSW